MTYIIAIHKETPQELNGTNTTTSGYLMALLHAYQWKGAIFYSHLNVKNRWIPLLVLNVPMEQSLVTSRCNLVVCFRSVVCPRQRYTVATFDVSRF
ncbi:hypothetical protein CEXT_519631 [Caerostris extrusa]|uniref:Uncharacterized protein n=1 Tax=Caerostris extrusa TaxID=172846 RepID=A0AAV4TLN7_CAEEX|nr:hypothetical protein CEXT_519631 [Caerostris extrusa]